jgi:hypothetical protein
VADGAQNVEKLHLTDRIPTSPGAGHRTNVRYRPSGWLGGFFGKYPYLLSAFCILLLTLAGAAVSVHFMSPSQPEKLTQIRIIFDTSSHQKADPQALMTVAQSAVSSDDGRAELARQIINDGLVLSSVPETTWLGLFSEVVLGRVPAPSDPVLRAIHDMRGRITLSQTADGNALFVTTHAETSGASARFALHAANRIVAHINASLPGATSGNVDVDRAKFEKAEAAVTGFQVRHGKDAMTKMETLTQDLALASDTVHELDARLAGATRDLATLASLKDSKALERVIPDEPVFLPLQDAARKYATASKALSQLSVQYGPKHPHVIAATQTLREAKAGVATTVKQIAGEMKLAEQSAKTELAQVKTRQQSLENELAVFGDAPQELQKLETELAQARDAYVSGLNDNSQQGRQASRPFAMADAPLAVNISTGLRQMMSSALVGGGFGLGVALAGLGYLYLRLRTHHQPVAIAAEAHVDPDMEDLQIDVSADEYAEETNAMDEDLYEDLVEAAEDFAVSNEHEQPHLYAANDIPLDQRVREVLMRRSVPAHQQDMAQIPPVLAAAMQGQFDVTAYDEPDEVSDIRRDIAVLRQRLHDYANYRAAHSA